MRVLWKGPESVESGSEYGKRQGERILEKRRKTYSSFVGRKHTRKDPCLLLKSISRSRANAGRKAIREENKGLGSAGEVWGGRVKSPYISKIRKLSSVPSLEEKKQKGPIRHMGPERNEVVGESQGRD